MLLPLGPVKHTPVGFVSEVRNPFKLRNPFGLAIC